MNLRHSLTAILGSLTLAALSAGPAHADTLNQIVQLKCLSGEHHRDDDEAPLYNGLFYVVSYEGDLSVRGFPVSTYDGMDATLDGDWNSDTIYYSGAALTKLQQEVKTYNALPCEKKTFEIEKSSDQVVYACAAGSQMDLNPLIRGVKTLEVTTVRDGNTTNGSLDWVDGKAFGPTELGKFNACDNFAAPLK